MIFTRFSFDLFMILCDFILCYIIFMRLLYGPYGAPYGHGALYGPMGPYMGPTGPDMGPMGRSGGVLGLRGRPPRRKVQWFFLTEMVFQTG